MSFGVSLPCLAESLTHSLERGHVDLAIIFADVDVDSITIGEGCDSLGAGRPAHQLGLASEGLNKENSLGRCHVEPVGRCLVIECFALLFVDVLTQFLLIIDYIVDAQCLGKIGKNYLRSRSNSWGCILQGCDLLLEHGDQSFKLLDRGGLVCHSS